ADGPVTDSGTLDPEFTTRSVGGLVGINAGDVLRSYSKAPVTVGGSGVTTVGGLVGENFGSVDQTYATGAISVTSPDATIGGLIGSGEGATASFWDPASTGIAESAGGTGLATAAFQDTEGFIALAAPLGWDFE